MKNFKTKSCKVCKTKFMPLRPLQGVCSVPCSYKYAKELSDKKQERESRKKKKELKEKIKTKSDYERDLQKEINAIVRLIDKGHVCISSGRPITEKQTNAGHLRSVGSNPSIRFHLFNIWAQSIEHNQHKGGMPLEMTEGIECTFGPEIKERCLGLIKQYTVLKLTIE